MYGGGFATIPAYLADLFGTVNVSAIHGRLLTAWSTAGILGPVLVNYIREFQIARGVAPAQAYTVTMYVLAGLLIVGFFCNLPIVPWHRRSSRSPRRSRERGLGRARPVGACSSGGWERRARAGRVEPGGRRPGRSSACRSSGACFRRSSLARQMIGLTAYNPRRRHACG